MSEVVYLTLLVSSRQPLSSYILHTALRGMHIRWSSSSIEVYTIQVMFTAWKAFPEVLLECSFLKGRKFPGKVKLTRADIAGANVSQDFSRINVSTSDATNSSQVSSQGDVPLV